MTTDSTEERHCDGGGVDCTAHEGDSEAGVDQRAVLAREHPVFGFSTNELWCEARCVGREAHEFCLGFDTSEA